jgi:hypothetical protein
MQDTATIIAHIMFSHGAVLNFSDILRNLDLCLETASKGAYSLAWDSEDLMIAEFGQTRIILVAGHQTTPNSGFTFTIAISPKDVDALPCPTLSSLHSQVIQQLVAHFEQPSNYNGVLWQRTKAPITAEAVELIVDALTDRLALLEGGRGWMPAGADSLETAQVLPGSALSLQFKPSRPM